MVAKMVSFHWRDYTHRHICPHWEFMQLQQGWDAFIHYAWWKVGARSLLAPLVCFAVNDVQYENYGIWTIWAVQLLQNYCLEACRTCKEEWNWITISVPSAHHTCVWQLGGNLVTGFTMPQPAADSVWASFKKKARDCQQEAPYGIWLQSNLH